MQLWNLMKNVCVFLIAAQSILVCTASEKLTFPANLLVLNKKHTHHIAIVEKSAHKLHIFESSDSLPRYVESYTIATGKRAGNKFVQGDRKTPEGIYKFQSFIPRQDLLDKYGKEGEIYGVGAFTMNYPNIIDIRNGKTGGGIWLHSTNDESRISKGLDSRGCVVVVDKDLINISKYLELEKTHIIVVQDLHLLRKETWQKNRNDITSLVEKWLMAWQSESFNAYIDFYHREKFSDSYRGNFQAFRKYKRAVFSSPGKPEINLSNLSVLYFKDYAVVEFEQKYKSNSIQDVGLKTLYLQKDKDYNWKIVAENWQKLPKEVRQDVAFTPSNRFFREIVTGQAN